MSTVDACDFDFGLGETVDEVRAQVRRMVRAEIAPLAGAVSTAPTSFRASCGRCSGRWVCTA